MITRHAAPRPAVPRPAVPLLMRNPIRRYAWGSTEVLAALQGRDETPHPEAELWMGAHPVAPSVVLDVDGHAVDLGEAIARDPAGMLGRRCLDAFGPRLPYLLKVLAVARPLSVQVHPTAQQAREGFAAEQAAGIEPDDPRRVFVDPYPKPEMLYAVTAFEALAGLRTAREAARLLGALDLLEVPALDDVLGRCRGAAGTVEAIDALVRIRPAQRRALVDAVRSASRAAEQHARRHGRDDDAAAFGWVQRLAAEHPEDPLVLGPLLLDLHRLRPGSTFFVPAGVPHAYLAGVGVEIMASSDNVVRAGLTSKRVDADVLLALLDPDARPLLDVPSAHTGPHTTTFAPPVPDFRLTRVVVGGGVSGDAVPDERVPTGSGGPAVVLCLAGEVEVLCPGHRVALRAGQSAFLPDGSTAVTLRGHGEVFVADVAPPEVDTSPCTDHVIRATRRSSM